MTAIFEPITARSSPGFTRTAPSAPHKGGGGKYANGVTSSKILATNNIFIGIWELDVVNGRPNGKIDARYMMENFSETSVPLRIVNNYT